MVLIIYAECEGSSGTGGTTGSVHVHGDGIADKGNIL
jgi:hypothetical protein